MNTDIISAVVDSTTNQVVNIIVGDGNSPTEDGTYLVQIPENYHIYFDIGFTWDGTIFLDQNGTVISN